jgi:hypothetical protein
LKSAGQLNWRPGRTTAPNNRAVAPPGLLASGSAGSQMITFVPSVPRNP